jgi:signal peptidase
MTTKNSDKTYRALTIIGTVLCIILVPILIINCTLIVKSLVNKDEVPSIGGTMPLIVLTDSMYPDIKSGDIIICKRINPEDIKVDDVISFYDPAGNGTAVVTHKVVEVINNNGQLSFRTKGINNNTEDQLPVSADKVIAEYTGIRIPAAGNVAIFMQSSTGLIVCVIVPIILFVGYDLIRRKKYEKGNSDDVEALKAELEALRAMQNAESKAQGDEQSDSEKKSD